ncbi:MAG: DUF481 domain-containing protein [Polyangiaceae bacterium]
MPHRSTSPIFAATLVASAFLPATALAQSAPTGAPPPEAKALVEAPKGPADAPKTEEAKDSTNASVSAGGVLTSGNSRLLALTANGTFELRRRANGFGASLLANYGQGAAPGKAIDTTAENLQGRLRYDRYLIDQMSLFLIGTGRYDRFQGLDFRLNVDPGLKYLFLNEPGYALWAEAGYDLQHDIRREQARFVDATGAPVPGAPLPKTLTDHSARLYGGFRYAFNKEVTLSTGLEYLQSFVDVKRSRLNYDAVVAAKIGGGLSLGFGFSLRYDNAPIPGKEKLDTSTTVSLIYAFSHAPPKPEDLPPEPVAAPGPPPGARFDPADVIAPKPAAAPEKAQEATPTPAPSSTPATTPASTPAGGTPPAPAPANTPTPATTPAKP